MARLKVNTKRILTAASQTKNFSPGGRKKLADNLRATRKGMKPTKLGRRYVSSGYRSEGEKMRRTSKASYPYRADIQSLLR